MEGKENEKIAMRVSIITIIFNVLLSVFKLIAGFLGKSSAMLSDAVHSISDVFSTVVVMVGIKISNREADKEYPYGHERMECIAAIILAMILFVVGFTIGYTGIMKVIEGNYNEIQVPGMIALIAAVVSIVVKEGMYWYTRWGAKKINSGSLMADAWHHRSDSLSSIGSLLGIIGARMGMAILDPIASVVICFFIFKVAYEVFMDSVYKLTDRSCNEDVISEMRELIVQENGVNEIDKIKTRLFGNKIYVDLEIQADGEKSLEETHRIAHNVHDKIENSFPLVKHCMVHVNPTICKEE